MAAVEAPSECPCDELRRQADLLEIVLEATHDGVVEWDLPSDTVLYNARWQYLFGADEPDAAGPTRGVTPGEGEPSRLLVLGESTVAGLGARTHEYALAGQFAIRLAEHIGRPVEWHVVGRNGVTARRVIDELLPLVPDAAFDHILLGIGGNDVMKLSSPRVWRRDMTELLGLLHSRRPDAVIFTLSLATAFTRRPSAPPPA